MFRGDVDVEVAEISVTDDLSIVPKHYEVSWPLKMADKAPAMRARGMRSDMQGRDAIVAIHSGDYSGFASGSSSNDVGVFVLNDNDESAILVGGGPTFQGGIRPDAFADVEGGGVLFSGSGQLHGASTYWPDAWTDTSSPLLITFWGDLDPVETMPLRTRVGTTDPTR